MTGRGFDRLRVVCLAGDSRAPTYAARVLRDMGASLRFVVAGRQLAEPERLLLARSAAVDVAADIGALDNVVAMVHHGELDPATRRLADAAGVCRVHVSWIGDEAG